jgi:hypothetical protein
MFDVKMAVLWNVPHCNIVYIHQNFGGTYCLHHHFIVLIMEAASFCEISSVSTTLHCTVAQKTAVTMKT